MNGLLQDALASAGPYAVDAPLARRPLARWTIACWCAAALYGAAMGSFGWKLRGSVYSSVKVPLLLVGSTALVTPFAAVLHAALGLRHAFPQALRGMLAAQGTLAVMLAALAPVTLFLQANGIDYGTALCAHGAAFALAVLASCVTFRRHHAALVEHDPTRRKLQQRIWWIWFGSYVFVAIKLGWLLRPFVGDPRLATAFLRPQAADENPYLVLGWTLVGLFWRLLAPLADA